MDIKKDAEDLLANAKKQRQEMSKSAESKGAAPASPAGKEKTEGIESEEEKKARIDAEAKAKVKEAEAKAKQDEEILSKKDEELKDDEKKRKAELLKIKQDVEDKEKKSNVQKRIDELTGKIKSLENDKSSDKSEIKALKDKVAAIEKERSKTPDTEAKEKIKKEMSGRIAKYLEEDKKLPREERREMTKEELDEWALEDYEGYNEWLTKRSIRRVGEENHLRREDFTNKKASELIDKFNKSYEKVILKHPELDIVKRKAELEKEGKPKEEIRKIIAQENPKWNTFMEIFEGDINKYLDAEDGASEIAEEMEKRLDKSKSPKETEVEALRKEIEALKAEKARLEELDVDVTSTRQAEPHSSKTELEKQQEELATSVGLSKDKLKVAVDRYKNRVR